MATITRFEDIEAWQLGRELKRRVYKCSKAGDFAKDFALKDQIRRAARSITANTAEQFDDMYRQTAEIARKIGAFMNYLQRTEVRGRKFMETPNPKPETRNPKLIR